jgi:hypothetical protein
MRELVVVVQEEVVRVRRMKRRRRESKVGKEKGIDQLWRWSGVVWE